MLGSMTRPGVVLSRRRTIRRGAWTCSHTSIRSVGGTARGLLIVTPGGLENYFLALHAVLTAGADSSHVRAVQAEYGIRPA
jgi:hypothetical protein